MKQVDEVYKRFWSFVKRTDGCWLWQGGLGKDGYGLLWCPTRRRSIYAHRLSYELTHGSVPEGHVVHHICGNHPCVKPEHLIAVTHQLHTLHHPQRSPTHCLQGHLRNAENVVIGSGGYLNCRTCNNRRSREYYWRKKEQRARVLER